MLVYILKLPFECFVLTRLLGSDDLSGSSRILQEFVETPKQGALLDQRGNSTISVRKVERLRPTTTNSTYIKTTSGPIKESTLLSLDGLYKRLAEKGIAAKPLDDRAKKSLQPDFFEQPDEEATDEEEEIVELESGNENDTAIDKTNEFEGTHESENYHLIYEPRPPNHRVIFYHIYISKNEEGESGNKKINLTAAALSIVEEQLFQVGQSATFPPTSSDLTAIPYNKTTVFYNTIGRKIDTSYIDKVCIKNNLQCHHLNHYYGGYEMRTLQDVHNYCLRKPDTQDHLVVYMHNKGSFHIGKRGSTHQRRSMTTAITSDQCYSALQQDQCTLCGLAFSPWKSPFYPGNFWAAQCTYVQKLLDPYSYKNQTFISIGRARKMQERGRVTLSLFPEKPYNLGTGRYAAEFWVGSHPTVRACDVASIAQYGKFLQHDLSFADMDLQVAPRDNVTTEEYIMKRMPNTTLGQLREYFLEVGYILRWYRLYNQVAPPDSWFWKYMPHGQLWKIAVEKHQRAAIHKMVNYGTPY